MRARTSVGRRQSCDICLEGPLLRDVHGFIERRGAVYFFVPTSGGQGTQLEEGRPFGLGDYSLEISFDKGTWTKRQTDVLAEPHPHIKPTHLTIWSNGQEACIELPHRLIVGSGPDAGLRVDDAGVSRVHFELRLDDKGLWVEDLGSTNGTFLSSFRKGDKLRRVKSSQVLLRETIIAGRTTFIANLARRERGDFGRLVGRSDVMKEKVYPVIEKAAPTDLAVLILGETGTGKEVVAQELCDRSNRVGRPFVIVNASAVPKEVFESQFFGHEKGAFTGATGQHKGFFEQAHGGTLFLDELGELPLELQPKVLRAIQEGVIRRIGGTEDVAVDVRMIAATNANLHLRVAEGRFREDLFYRLNTVTLRLPPLRERPGDVKRLIEHFLELLAPNGDVTDLEDEAWTTALAYAWPGNVRELANSMQRAHAFRATPFSKLSVKDLGLDDVPTEVSRAPSTVKTTGPEGWVRALGRPLDETIYEIILMELDAGPTQKDAAKRLEITPKTLRARLKRMEKGKKS
ncbi:MAG: sigma 54-interacting transcriptional regulator [Deltaproteobacteria bacterium]|nr:sigma 54-interacting transcriptional regulator [Deltaproteobacteria bacterium]